MSCGVIIGITIWKEVAGAYTPGENLILDSMIVVSLICLPLVMYKTNRKSYANS